MKARYLVFLFVVFSLFVYGCTQNTASSDDKGAIMDKDTIAEKETMEKKEAMQKESVEKDAMMEKGEVKEEESMMIEGYKGNVLAGTTSKYIEFSQPDYEKALKENKKIVLNFYASWCPTCRAEHSHITAAFNELDDSSIIGFRVNYKDSDTDSDEEALAKQFGISYQHTKVILKDGQRVLKAPDAWDKQRYLDELSKV